MRSPTGPTVLDRMGDGAVFGNLSEQSPGERREPREDVRFVLTSGERDVVIGDSAAPA